MVIMHYLKREYETLFVHRFGNETMPRYRVFINSSHYWILGGLLIAYFLFSPEYVSPSYPKAVCWALIGGFYFAEFMNLRCHYVLRNLRAEGSKERGIPNVY